ncbi:PLP-dependent aminotransferase family protein [Rhizobium sp. P38BS-XIX]|uniref:MocR-like pyridoxine biosynthesis transcription factor PdxR n=1 Tax=Rhizobium sp. P38BS-XIX TaxID=2726740 RepID=UPI001456964E|nr:PLP-dependent aminotransferase family protein [Rhizobium sp. P38BS-XIX]NLR99853.1 PLP-dependent aminotransferase family protein [Rhizobium sp. P38BS-XIX]
MTSLSFDLLLKLDRASPLSLGRQIQAQLRDAIRAGSLHPGVVLPSTRTLATDLGISRPVVLEAYDQLAAEGYLLTRPGARPVVAYVAAPSSPPGTAHVATQTSPIRYDLRSSTPDLSMFPRKGWLKALRHAIETMPAPAFGYDGRHGTSALRSTLAEYLGRVRGVITSAERIIVTSGFAEARALACAVLKSAGVDRLGVEDPSYSAWQTVDQAGLARIAIAVDEDGIVVDELERSAVQAVFVTPAHQFPTGVVLTKDRRRALVDWLHGRGAYAFEDDYDAEFRYDQNPVGALQGLAPDRIFYAGTVSKTLAPALRLGWLVVPAEHLEAAMSEQLRWNEGSPRIDQNALAAFIDSGDYDRHLRMMRRTYRARRDLLTQLIAEHLPHVTVNGIAAGLHATLSLPEGIDEAEICAAAGRRGVAIEGLKKYRLSIAGPPGLLLGYGGVSESDLRVAIRIIAESIANFR